MDIPIQIRESGLLLAVYDAVSHLDARYPDFALWYWNTVVPGLDDGTRSILAIVSVQGIDAVAISKRTPIERKLCTLWVHPRAASRGVSKFMTEAALSWIGSRTPVMTMAGEVFEAMRPLLHLTDARLTGIREGLYRKESVELVFNGC